jgi:hypothetical protein
MRGRIGINRHAVFRRYRGDLLKERRRMCDLFREDMSAIDD